jgi:hypothetical protein
MPAQRRVRGCTCQSDRIFHLDSNGAIAFSFLALLNTEQLLFKKLQQRVEHLGYQVQLIPITATLPPS